MANPLQDAIANGGGTDALPSGLTPEAIDQMTQGGYLPPGQWTPQQAAEIIRSPDYAPQTPPVPSVLANSAPPKPDVSRGTGQLAPTPTAASMFGLGGDSTAAQQQQAQGVLAAAQKAGGAPVVPYAPPATPAAPAPARNPLQAQAAGGAFDPYANQKIAAKGEEGALLNRELGVTATGGARDAALGGVAGENAGYAGQVERDAQIHRMQLAKIEAEHAKLVDHESKRDYTKEYWGGKSVGSKIAAFLSATAGGFLQGYRGLPNNPALEQINKDVDRHVQAARENSHLKIDADKTLYDHFRDKTHDDETARALTHAATLDSLGADLEKARGATRDQEEIGHIDDQLQAVRMQTAQWKDAAKAAAARANAPKTAEQLLALGKGEAEIEHMRAETGKAGAETNKLQAEAAAAGVAPGGSVPAPTSTAYDPTRLFQGTDAFANRQGQDRWNSQVLAALHKANPVRSPEVLNAMAQAYKVDPGDTPSTVERKISAFQADYRKRPGNPLQAQAAAADEEPEGFAAP